MLLQKVLGSCSGDLMYVPAFSSAETSLFPTTKVILHDYMDEWGGESVTDTGW